jgi:hypothetical protein
MHALEIVQLLIGGFYVFAGVLITRVALTSRVLDQAIAAISAEQPSRADTLLTAWHLASATLILAGGAALMLRLEAAVWLFLAAALAQAAYLFVIAPNYFDRSDPPDAKGRQQTTNAFFVYSAATAFVVWCYANTQLRPWSDVGWPILALAGAIVAAHIAYIAWGLSRPRKSL